MASSDLARSNASSKKGSIKDAGSLKPPTVAPKPKDLMVRRAVVISAPVTSSPKPPSGVRASVAVPATDEEAAKQIKKRINCVKEILSTETSYVGQINIICDLYLNPLKKMAENSRNNGILSEEEIRIIFSNISQVQDLNQKFLKDLREKILSAKPDERNAMIGSVFLKMGPFFKLYTQYVNNHPKAVEKLATLREKKERFRNFLMANERTSSSKGLDIESLLITPVQRIPRYKLLLEVLQKSTEPTHPDSEDIKEALKLIGDVADSINSAVKESQNRQQLIDIQKQFGKDVDLVVPSRRFIMKGLLTKKCRNSNKDFTFFLFNDLLLYAHGGGLTQYVLHRKIPITSKFKAQDVPDKGSERHMMEILNSQRSFIVYAADASVKQLWLKAFNQCTEEVRAKSGATDNSAEELAPVWDPDDSSSCCTICLEEFGLLKRRHHCRKCGILVCGECSKGRTKTGQRICDRCVRDEITGGIKNLNSTSNFSTMRSNASSISPTTDGKDVDDEEDMDDLEYEAPPDMPKFKESQGIRFRAIESHKADPDADELEVSRGDPIFVHYSNQDDVGNVWWYAQNMLTNKLGWIDPGIVEEEFNETKTDSGMFSFTASSDNSSSQSVGVYKAVQEYAGNPDNEELGFDVGDIVDILSTHESGYWFGSNRSTGQTGWCDPGYLEPAYIL